MKYLYCIVIFCFLGCTCKKGEIPEGSICPEYGSSIGRHFTWDEADSVKLLTFCWARLIVTLVIVPGKQLVKQYRRPFWFAILNPKSVNTGLVPGWREWLSKLFPSIYFPIGWEMKIPSDFPDLIRFIALSSIILSVIMMIVGTLLISWGISCWRHSRQEKQNSHQ